MRLWIYKRYKLHLNVKDDSGSCKLMMLDTIGSTIVGCEAVQIWDGSYDEASIFYKRITIHLYKFL